MPDSAKNTEPKVDASAPDVKSEAAGNEAAPATTEKAATSAAVNPAGKKLRLGKAVDVYMDKPIKRFKNAYVQCFQAKNLGTGSDLIAVFCDRYLPPRFNKLSHFESIQHPNLVSLVESGVVLSPLDNKEYFVLAYEDNLGAPLVEEDIGCALGIKPEDAYTYILLPIIEVLKDMRNKDLFHGTIRPSNIFRGTTPGLKKIILGDCISVPPGVVQASIFEPIERALAQPTGKGPGVLVDDLYALGVTIAFLLRPKDVLKGLSEKEIIIRKIELGTFSTVLGGANIKGNLVEFLRGVLQDDPKQRWDLDDVTAWIDGQRGNITKQPTKAVKANRPILIDGKKISFPAVLAIEGLEKPNELEALLDNRELGQWIERSIDDKAMQKGIELALKSTKRAVTSKSSMYQSKMVSRLAMVLHPIAPLRYREFAVSPLGAGIALGDAYHGDKDVSVYDEIIRNDEFIFWLTNNEGAAWDTNAMMSVFASCREFVSTTVPGYGLERCLYYLNENIPCLSPILDGYYVRTPEELLIALDKIAAKKNRAYKPFDRHILAFLLVKERNLLENSLIDINSKASWRQVFGILKVFSTIQQLAGMGELPGLANWMLEIMEPIYKRYHNRETRLDLKTRLHEKCGGSLEKMFKYIDNNDVVANDSKRFKEALRDYIMLDKERDIYERGLENPGTVGVERGHQAAAVFCVIIAVCLILGFVSVSLGNHQYLGF